MVVLRVQLEDSHGSSSDKEEDLSFLNVFMRTGIFQCSLLEVSKDTNGNIIESNKINRSSVPLLRIRRRKGLEE